MQGHHDESRQYKYSMSNPWCGNSGARGARWYNNSRRENEKKNIDPRAQTKHLLIFPGRWHGQLTLRLFPISTLYVSNILNIWQEKISYSKTAYLSGKDAELRSVHFWIDAEFTLSASHLRSNRRRAYPAATRRSMYIGEEEENPHRPATCWGGDSSSLQA